MLILKIVIIACVVAVTVFIGGMAAAWRRACLVITRRVLTTNYLMNEGVGSERTSLPGIGQISNDDMMRFTPAWASLYNLVALTFLAVVLLLGLALFRWYSAIGIEIATYLLVELTGFAFFPRDSHYFVLQLHAGYLDRLAIARRFDDCKLAEDMSTRIRELRRAYADVFGEDTES